MSTSSTSSSRQCRSRTKSGGQCRNISLSGSHFCYRHIKNQPKSVEPIVEKRKTKRTGFADLDDSIVQMMCQLYIDQGDYVTLSRFIKTSQRVKRICQPLLIKSNLIYDKPIHVFLIQSDSNRLGYKTNAHISVDVADTVQDMIERAASEFYVDPNQFDLFQIKRRYTPKGVSIVRATKFNRSDRLPIQALHNYRLGTVTLVQNGITLHA